MSYSANPFGLFFFKIPSWFPRFFFNFLKVYSNITTILAKKLHPLLLLFSFFSNNFTELETVDSFGIRTWIVREGNADHLTQGLFKKEYGLDLNSSPSEYMPLSITAKPGIPPWIVFFSCKIIFIKMHSSNSKFKSRKISNYKVEVQNALISRWQS